MINVDSFRRFVGPTVPVLLTTLCGNESTYPFLHGDAVLMEELWMHVNAAPVSWVQKVSYKPRLVSVSLKPGMDTLRNMRTVSSWFGMSVPMAGWEQDVVVCGKKIPYGISELGDDRVRFVPKFMAGFPVVTLRPSVQVAACYAQQFLEFGDHVLVIAEVRGIEDCAIDCAPAMYMDGKTFVSMGEEIEVEGY